MQLSQYPHGRFATAITVNPYLSATSALARMGIQSAGLSPAELTGIQLGLDGLAFTAQLMEWDEATYFNKVDSYFRSLNLSPQATPPATSPKASDDNTLLLVGAAVLVLLLMNRK